MPENLYGQPYVQKEQEVQIPSINQGGSNAFQSSEGRLETSDERYNRILKQTSPQGFTATPKRASEVSSDLTGRYDTVVYGANNEDAWAAKQSGFDKVVNGTTKGLGLFATTFVGGTAGILWGTGKALLPGGKFSDVWKNEVTENLDKINKEVDNKYLPNYESDKEKNASPIIDSAWWTWNLLGNKLIKNAGFAVGAIYSGNLFGKVLGAAGKGLGSMFNSAAEYSQAWKRFAGFNQNLARLFSRGANEEAYLLASKNISNLADFEAQTSALANAASKFTKINNFQDIGQRLAMSMYSAGGESAFEGIGNYNAFKDKRVQEYKDKWGFEPTGEELKKIEDAATSVGNASFALNMAILTGTEFVQLPYLIGSSYKNNRAAANAFMETQGIAQNAAGKWIKKEATSKFGKVANFIKEKGAYVFAPSEMAQEMLQNAVSVGTDNYYNKAYKGEEASNFADGFASMLGSAYEGAKQTLTTKEGLEAGILGGVSGGLMQIKSTFLNNRNQNVRRNELINSLNLPDNTFTNALNDRINSFQRGIKLQEDGEQASIQGDKLEFLDNKHDRQFNYLYTRIKHGRLDLVKEDISERMQQAATEQGYKQMQANGFAPTNLSREDYVSSLVEFQNHAERTAKILEANQLAYSGKVNQEGKRLYSDEVIEKLSYAASKVADYDVRIPQISSELLSHGIDVQSVLERELTNPIGLEKELKQIEEDFPIQADKLKQDLVDLVELSQRRKLFIEEYKNIKSSPENFNTAPKPTSTSEPVPNDTKTITLKTKDGEEQLEVNESYVAGSKEIKTKEGNTIPAFLKFTLLGETEEGDVLIKTKDGKTHTISKEAFENYKLGKVSALSKSQRFFVENSKRIFNFQMKGGKSIPGSITYDKNERKLYFESQEKRKDGKPVKRIPLNNDLSQFSPQSGYNRAQIWTEGEYSQETQDAVNAPLSQEEINDQKNIEAKIAERRNILRQAKQQIQEKVDRVNNKLVAKKEQLKNLEQEVKDLLELREKNKYDNTTKITNFNKVVNTSIKGLARLSTLKTELENEIADLEQLKAELAFDISYFEDFEQNLEELPTSLKEFRNELKSQIKGLEDITVSIGEDINSFTKMIATIQDVIKDFASLLKSAISKINSDYPSYIKDSFDRIIAGNDYMAEANSLKEYISDLKFAEDTEKEIKLNEDKVNEVSNKIQSLYEQLEEVENEQRAKQKILDAFEVVIQRELAKKAEEAKVANNKELQNKLEQQQKENDNQSGVLNIEEPQEEFTYSKADLTSFLSKEADFYDTSAEKLEPLEEVKINRSHQKRRLNFLNYLARVFDTKANDYKVLAISRSNEETYGLKGLIDYMLSESKDKLDKDPIVKLYVKKEGDKLFIIDKEGKPISELGKIGTSNSNTEDKKADIERRRQEELQKGKTDKKGLIELEHSSRNNTNPLSNWIENSPLYTSRDRGSYKEYGKSFTFLVKENAVIKSLFDFDGKFNIDLDAHDISSKGVHPYPVNSDLVVALRKEGVDILIDDWGEYIILNPKSVYDLEKINAKYDAEYVDKVKKGEFTAQQAKDALKEINRLTPELSKQLDDAELAALKQPTQESNVAEDVLPQLVEQGVFGVFHDDIGEYKKGSKAGEKNFSGEYSEEDLTKVKQQFEDWKTRVNQSTESIIYDIQGISRGISLRDGENKSVFKTGLITKVDLEQTNLIQVPSKEGSITTKDGVSLKLPLGQPVLVKGGNIELLNNRQFAPQESKSIFSVLKQYVKLSNEQNNEAKKLGTYLRGILYFSTPKEGKPVTKGQIYFSKGNLHFGEEITIPFTESSVQANESRILEFLENTYNNTNSHYLTSPDYHNQPFFSYDENLREVKHENYQAFLLLGDNPFLQTTLRPLDNNRPNIISRYTILSYNSEFDYKVAPKQQQIAEPVKQDSELTIEQVKGLKIKNVKSGKETNLTLNGVKITSEPGFLKDGMNTITLDRLNKNLKDGIYTIVSGSKPIIPTSSQQYTLENVNGVTFKNSKGIQGTVSIENGMIILPIFKGGRTVTNLNEINSLAERGLLTVISDEVEQPFQEEIQQEQQEESEFEKAKKAAKNAPIDREEYKLAEEFTNYKQEDVIKFLQYVKDKTPFNVQLLNQILKTPNGINAWGSYKDMVIKLYEAAIEGTGYHEVFEGVYKEFLSTKEKENLYKEFKERKGNFTFFDGEQYSSIPYSEATQFQMKETLADEFSEFVLKPHEPQSLISKWFNNLWNFIKSILSGRVTTIEDVFKKIDTGQYKSPATRNISVEEAEEFKLADLQYIQQHEVVRGVAIDIIQTICRDGHSLSEFEESELPIEDYFKETFNKLNRYYTTTMFQTVGNEDLQKAYFNLWGSIKQDWDNVKELVKEQLKTIAIVEAKGKNDEIEYNKEYIGDKYYWQNDAKNTASRSIKLLFLTTPESVFTDKTSITGRPEVISRRTTATLLQEQINYSKEFNAMLLRMSEVNTFEEKFKLLSEISKKNPNFERINQRLNTSTQNELNDWKLKIRWYNVMSKQNPTAYIQYNDGKGGSDTGTANLESSKKLLVQNWVDGMKQKSFTPNKVFKVVNDEFVLNTKELKFEISKPQDKINFLSQLGIDFNIEDYNRLSTKDQKTFNDGLTGLASQLKKKTNYPIENSRSMESVKNLEQIAEAALKAGKEFNSMYPNLEGEQQSQFTGTNAISRTSNDLNNSRTKEQLFEVQPQLEQVKDSLYLNKLLYNSQGEKTALNLEVGFIQGTLSADGKPIPGDKLTPHQRLLQEINQNLSGRYYTLVPADSTTQWLLNMTNPIPFSQVEGNQYDVNQLISTYYETEKAAYEELKNVNTPKLDKRAGIFKELSENYTLSPEQVVKNFEKFLEQTTKDQFEFLTKFKVIQERDGEYKINGLDNNFRNKNFGKTISKQDVLNMLKFRTLNYAINNIELQKLYFGNILEYSDPTKRYKLFMSPREASMYGVQDYNNYLNETQNEGLINGRLGKFIHSDFQTTATMQDVGNFNETLSKMSPGYENSNSTDAQAYSTLPGFKARRLKEGNWTEAFEEQYQYNLALDRQLMLEDGELTNKDYPTSLQQQDKKLIEKGNPNSAFFYVEKPIVSGFVQQDGKYNPLVDKFSIASFSYSTIRNTNFRKHYLKMLDQNIGYIIQESGRKVGARTLNNYYNEDGTINETPFQDLINVPYSAFGVQTDTSSLKESQTRGTQITKLAIVNLFEDGNPISEKAGELARKNIDLLKEQVEIGYANLLNTFGAEDTEGGFKILDKSKIVELLKKEMLRREMPENIKQLLDVNDEKQLVTAFEAFPNYIQIKNILYSYVDKNITSPKVSGAPQVQISGALMEKYGVKRVSHKGKEVFVSAGLHMYTPEEPWIEVLMPFHSSDILRKAGIKWNSPEELYKLIKESPDAKQILSAVGFRIPTQEINSVENIRIAGFLPEEMGNSIVVPEEITTKAGSDFDIDKLNTYLKNIYVDAKGQIRTIPYFGIGEQAKEKLKKHFEENAILDFLNDKIKPNADALDNVDFEASEEEAMTTFDKMYKQSIENEYFTNIQNILELPENFERLITPNTDKDLKGIRDQLVELAPNEFLPSGEKSIINPMYMLAVRHEGLVTKGLVGIAAVAQTGIAVRQLSDVYVDPSKAINLSFTKNKYFRDGKVYLPHNRNEEGFISLSKIKDKEGRYITDKNSQYINGTVDVFKDAYLAQINFNRRTAGVNLFMENIGIPNSKELPIVGMFINQPIIRDLINEININESNPNTLFSKKSIEEVQKRYKSNFKLIEQMQIKFGELSNKGEYGVILKQLKSAIKAKYSGEEFSEEQKAMQMFVLNEFLKYAVMAEQLFGFQQGTNWDTSTFNDNNSVYFKNAQLENSRKSIISSADTLLNSTFIGEQRKAIIDSTEVLNDVLLTENPIVQKYLNKIKERIAKSYKSLDDKNTIARKAEESLLSYLIQTSTGLNTVLEKNLISTETALINELKRLKTTLKNNSDIIGGNIILNNLIPSIKGKKQGATKNIKLAIQPRDVFSKNIYADAFEELLRNPITEKFAQNLVRLHFLQNGIASSPISLKDIIPARIFAQVVNKGIEKIENEDVLNSFIETGSFYKNNVNNDLIVKDVTNDSYLDVNVNDNILDYLDQVLPNEQKPLILFVDAFKGDFSSPFVTHSDYGNEFDINAVTTKRLFKRVENSFGEPITLKKVFQDPLTRLKEKKTVNVYVQTNALGDGFRAQEHYENNRPSVFQNGFEKTNEIDSTELGDALTSQEEYPEKQLKLPTKSKCKS